MTNAHYPVIDKAFINGQWQAAATGKTIEVFNPANGKVIGTIPNMGVVETRQAIDAAYNAFAAWSTLTALERADYLMKWYELILKNKEVLAILLSVEQGRPLAEARGEIDYGASFIRWYAEEARRVNGDIIPNYLTNQRQLVIKQPVGVVAAITPWNFPNAMVTRKCAPALAAGCTVVLKPSELTPYSALALAQLAQEAGIPDGVLNVVTGDAAPIGEGLCDDFRVRKLSFTGSTRVGQLLAARCAPTLKRVSLELGGNAPVIIFDDADLEKAIAGVIASKFRNTGQTCVCANRILVQEKILNVFVEKLKIAIQKLTIADPSVNENAQLGPLINKAAIDKVERLVKDALAQGAECLLGGQASALGENFYEPTVLTNLHSDMLVANEEIFGPVAAIFKFKDEEEAIALANNTTAGLASYIFTENNARIWRISEQLAFGIVSVNTGIFSNTTVPFGGMKLSGYGREGSRYGIEEYLNIKYLCIGM